MAMNPRSYNRQSFESIRQAERQRFQELSAVRAEFNLAESWLAAAVENGTDPAEARAQRDQIRAEDERRAAAGEVHLLPGGPVGGAAAVELMTRAYFGRPDVAATVELPAGQRVQFAGRGRDALGRIAGVGGPGVDPWQLWRVAVRPHLNLSAAGLLGEVSAQPAGGLPAALRGTLDTIVRHDWQRSGSWWMAASMVIDGIDYRSRRHWIAQASVQDSEIVPEAGEAPHSPDGGARGWMYSDLQVQPRKETTLLSRQRVFNVGGVELGAWISAKLALWHDALDRQVADLLTTSAAGPNGRRARSTAAHFWRGGRGSQHGKRSAAYRSGPAGRSLIWPARIGARCMSAVPGPARATGDEAAVLSRGSSLLGVSRYRAISWRWSIRRSHADALSAALGGRLDPQAAGRLIRGRDAGRGGVGCAGALVARGSKRSGAVSSMADGAAVGVVRMVMQ